MIFWNRSLVGCFAQRLLHRRLGRMSSNDDHNKGSKKRKKKYSSPFRIKIGCLVALRYRSRGNNVSILMSDRDSSTSSGSDGGGKDGFGSYQEEVASAQFSEVWTDPRWGRDSGLALIGSRIRCFFPKAVLSKPYNATSRLLEGTIVNVVRDQLSTGSSSFGIDLLIDNKDNKMLNTTLPFLKRVDIDGQGDPAGKVWKESEQRRRQYEERIKGGKHKAVVRVSLSMSSFGRARQSGRNPLEAKWVIRKRVPIKVFRRKSVPVTTPEEATAESVNDKGEEAKEKSSGGTDKTQVKETSGKDETDGGKAETILSQASQILPDSATNPKQQKREPNRTTAYNKDFSLPRYLGDGNDSTTQQEGNWRWEAGRYHNPCSSALFDRPISKSLLEKLSYNFVGEVISIHPTQSQQSKDLSIDTLAMVTIRLLLLPEHTHSGRLTHHGAFDLFECDDLDSNMGFFRGEHTAVTEDGGAKKEIDRETCCFLRVPIEELVIVEKSVTREPFYPNKKQKTDHDRKEMIIRHSYSFFEDRYRDHQEPKQDHANLAENPAMQVCRRCRHLSASNKRLAGIPQPLCQSCFDVLKTSNAARLVNDGKSKSKTYDCDEFFCTEKKNSDFLVALANEISESESKLGSTLGELEDYTDGTDSGFIATRFILKGMNPVDFSITPSSLSSFIGLASAKPVTKIKARISKATKKANSGKDALRKNGNKSPVRNGSSSRDGVVSRIVAKNEPFRSTSARLLPYDVSNRKFDVSASELYQWKIFRSSMSSFPEKPRNLRQHRKRENGRDSSSGNTEKKKLQGRAARAKQRRLLRGVSSLGVEVDILAGRETNVRFERSNIHGWGVFSDIDIRQGEMIIEYRGELIGNAMAEKREKEYEAAKIGSDYMFRIDEYTICDASKQGNVARFINASCSPNCYPKIIVLDGVKRVAVYAKRDIRAGEELCYDYKFDLEYDPAKRIPCICGAPDCRGFLNWDKRYVTVPNAAVPAENDGTKNKSNDKADSENLAKAKR